VTTPEPQMTTLFVTWKYYTAVSRKFVALIRATSAFIYWSMHRSSRAWV